MPKPLVEDSTLMPQTHTHTRTHAHTNTHTDPHTHTNTLACVVVLPPPPPPTHTHTHTDITNTWISSDRLVEKRRKKRQIGMQKRRGGF